MNLLDSKYHKGHCCFRRIFAGVASFIGFMLELPLLCVCKNTETEEMTMKEQCPVKQCQYCGGTDIGIGWQHGDALVTFKKHGMFGNRLQYLICRRCGAVLYQCVAEPHKFPRV